MNTPIQLQDLVAEIVHTYPSASIEFDPLPSGVCFLWATVADRNFSLEYDPKGGAGVSENLPNTPLFIGHDHGFHSLNEAIPFFKQMLAKATEEALVLAH